MLSELIRMWKKIDLLEEALNDFLSMIDNVETMFRFSMDAVFGARKVADAQGMLYKTDIIVNKTERNIRKRLVEHLAVNPRGDAPACLILMSVSKDVERAGDYCKNLLEVAAMLRDPVANSKYLGDLRELTDMVAATFTKTRKAFANEDQVLGNEVIHEEVQIAKRSDATVARIANDDSLKVNEAVCLALAFRFLKRVNAHLGNVASSVVMPLHKIDYFDKKWKDQSRSDKGGLPTQDSEKNSPTDQ